MSLAAAVDAQSSSEIDPVGDHLSKPLDGGAPFEPTSASHRALAASSRFLCSSLIRCCTAACQSKVVGTWRLRDHVQYPLTKIRSKVIKTVVNDVGGPQRTEEPKPPHRSAVDHGAKMILVLLHPRHGRQGRECLPVVRVAGHPVNGRRVSTNCHQDAVIEGFIRR